jgi:hypothetical protein
VRIPYASQNAQTAHKGLHVTRELFNKR